MGPRVRAGWRRQAPAWMDSDSINWPGWPRPGHPGVPCSRGWRRVLWLPGFVRAYRKPSSRRTRFRSAVNVAASAPIRNAARQAGRSFVATTASCPMGNSTVAETRAAPAPRTSIAAAARFARMAAVAAVGGRVDEASAPNAPPRANAANLVDQSSAPAMAFRETARAIVAAIRVDRARATLTAARAFFASMAHAAERRLLRLRAAWPSAPNAHHRTNAHRAVERRFARITGMTVMAR